MDIAVISQYVVGWQSQFIINPLNTEFDKK